MKTSPRTRVLSLAALSLPFLLSACAAVEWAQERLGALTLKFDLVSVDVGTLAYPSNVVEVARDLSAFNAAARAKYGVNVRCRIRAANPGAFAIAFDGATARLRVRDTTGLAPGATGVLPAFRVEPGRDTVVEVTFPLRLNNPVFARPVWNAIIRGENVPYRIDARLAYNLPLQYGQTTQGVPKSGAISLDVAKGSVNARETGATALDILLRAIAAAL